MDRSFERRKKKAGWTAKQLSDFLKKHGIIRQWKTVLDDIRNGERAFKIVKIDGCVVVPEDTVKKYLRFMAQVKKAWDVFQAEKMIKNLNDDEKERLEEKNREKQNKKDPFRGEVFGIDQYAEDLIIRRHGVIKAINKF